MNEIEEIKKDDAYGVFTCEDANIEISFTNYSLPGEKPSISIKVEGYQSLAQIDSNFLDFINKSLVDCMLVIRKRVL